MHSSCDFDVFHMQAIFTQFSLQINSISNSLPLHIQVHIIMCSICGTCCSNPTVLESSLEINLNIGIERHAYPHTDIGVPHFVLCVFDTIASDTTFHTDLPRYRFTSPLSHCLPAVNIILLSQTYHCCPLVLSLAPFALSYVPSLRLQSY